MLSSCLCLQLLLKLLNVLLLLLLTQPALLLHSLLLCTMRPFVFAGNTCTGKGVLQLKTPLTLINGSLAASSTLHAKLIYSSQLVTVGPVPSGANDTLGAHQRLQHHSPVTSDSRI